MLKEKALRTIKAEFKEYKQRILTNLSKEYIFEIAYQIYVKSRIYDFLIKVGNTQAKFMRLLYLCISTR
mgnify:CR=1 FL=1